MRHVAQSNMILHVLQAAVLFSICAWCAYGGRGCERGVGRCVNKVGGQRRRQGLQCPYDKEAQGIVDAIDEGLNLGNDMCYLS